MACKPAVRMADDVGAAGVRMSDDLFDTARRPLVDTSDELLPQTVRHPDDAADARIDRAQDTVGYALEAVDQLTEEGDARDAEAWADTRWGRGVPKSQWSSPGRPPRVESV